MQACFLCEVPYPYGMKPIAQKFKDQGIAAEKAFAEWLDRSVLPYIYVEQSKITLPQSLKGDIKRPDYIVGLPLIGSVCCDVKCKSFYDDHLIFDAYEYRNLANFQLFFMSSVWVVCFDPADMDTCYIFLNEWLLREKTIRIKGRVCARMPLREMLKVNVTKTRFQDAMMRAVDLKLDDWEE